MSRKGVRSNQRAARHSARAVNSTAHRNGAYVCQCPCHQVAGAGTHPGEPCICKRATRGLHR